MNIRFIVPFLTFITFAFLFNSCDQSTATFEDDPDQEIEQDGKMVIDLRRGQDVGKYVNNRIQYNTESSAVEPTHVRVVIRHIEDSFKRVLDIEVPTEEETIFTLPVRENYIMDAISYLDGSFKRILKHDQETGIEIIADEVTYVNMVLVDFSEYMSVSLPDTVFSDEEFDVEVTDNRILSNEIELEELRSFKGFFQLRAEKVAYTEYDASSGNSEAGSINWPNSSRVVIFSPLTKESDDEDYIYFQIVRYLPDDLLRGDDDWPRWRYFYPDLSAEELKTVFELPEEEGGVGVTITY